MATARPFAYNTGASIPGTEQVGNLAVGTPTNGFASTGISEWWNGPDEELGYVIACQVPSDTQPTPVELSWDPGYVGVGNTLSVSNTVVTNSGVNSSVLAKRLFGSAEKVMFSIKINQTTNGEIGAGQHGMNLGSYVGSGDGKSVGFSYDGKYYYYGGDQGVTGLPTWGAVNDVVDIAVNMAAGLIYIRVNGGNWNGTLNENPASGGGSIGMGGLTNLYPAMTPYQGIATILETSTYAVPAGFTFLGQTLASVGFFRSDALTEPSFVEMTNNIFGQIFLTGDECKTYLNTNGYWTSWGTLPGGMVLYLDSGVSASYSGSGSTWYDLSGYGNNGTINGATYVGGTAAAFSFNGSNNYVDFASVTEIPIGNDPYTISVWFNSDEMPADRGFVGWGNYGAVNQVNAWRLRNSGVSGFRHYWWGNDLDYQTPMSAGSWYNAVAAYQNGSRKLYLNNVKVAEDTPTGHNVPSASNLTIGVTNYAEWFKGKIAQVIIYKRQATEAEITAIWNSGKNRFGA